MRVTGRSASRRHALPWAPRPSKGSKPTSPCMKWCWTIRHFSAERSPSATSARSCSASAPAERAKEGEAMATEVEAQITGSVWKIEKVVGDAVQEGDVLIILESMKMEIPVEAPCGGRVSEIRVQEGASVEEGAVLVVIA